MAKLKKFKAKPTSSDINVNRERSKALLQGRKDVRNEKFEKEKEYYNNKLVSMVQDTLSVINSDTTAEELAAFLKTGDKEWKALCAIGRKTRNISVPIELYMQTMIANLLDRKILTTSVVVNEELESGKITTGIDVFDKEVEKGISIEDINPLKEGEVQEFTEEEKQEAIETVSELNNMRGGYEENNNDVSENLVENTVKGEGE